MSARQSRAMPLALAAAALCACIAAAPAMATITDPGTFLDETEHLRIRDHASSPSDWRRSSARRRR